MGIGIGCIIPVMQAKVDGLRAGYCWGRLRGALESLYFMCSIAKQVSKFPLFCFTNYSALMCIVLQNLE